MEKQCPLSFTHPDYTTQTCLKNRCEWYDEKIEHCVIFNIIKR